jgi:hypothetical protein
MSIGLGRHAIAALNFVFWIMMLHVSACSSAQGERMDDARLIREMERSLNSLIHEAAHESYVVFEDRESGRFVQFTLDRDALIFDLPARSLRADDIERADRLLGGLGIIRRSGPLLDGPNGRVLGTWTGFNEEMSGGASQGAQIALLVFREIFLIEGNLDLVVEFG